MRKNSPVKVPKMVKSEADALAVRVRSKLTEFHDQHPEIKVRDFHEEDGGMDLLWEAREFVDSCLPRMSKKLAEEFDKDTTGIRDKTLIFKVFAQFALTEDRMARAMGLVKNAIAENGGIAIGALMNINLNEIRATESTTLTQRLLEHEEEDQ
jgi:hypothetical protein